MKDTQRQMFDDDQDPGSTILTDFRKAIGNHLVQEMDPYDANARKDALHEIVMVCNVNYKAAEEMIEGALLARAQVFAHSLIGTICDRESENAACAAVRAECNCTALMANDLIERAIAGEFVDIEAQCNRRDFSVESIAMNKKRLVKYTPMMNWWKKHREGNQEEMIDPNQTRACGVSLDDLTETVSVAKAMEAMQMAKIDRVIPVTQELETLTNAYDEVERKWRIYLNISLSNEVGPHRMLSGSRGRKQHESQMVRGDVRVELFDAFQEMLDPVLTEKQDKEDIKRLLVSLEEVEVETDMYVDRLESNLIALRQDEEGQVDSMLIQQSQMNEVMSKLDSVNEGLNENLNRMKNMTGNGAAVFRLLMAIVFGMSVLFCVYIVKAI